MPLPSPQSHPMHRTRRKRVPALWVTRIRQGPFSERSGRMGGECRAVAVTSFPSHAPDASETRPCLCGSRIRQGPFSERSGRMGGECRAVAVTSIASHAPDASETRPCLCGSRGMAGTVFRTVRAHGWRMPCRQFRCSQNDFRCRLQTDQRSRDFRRAVLWFRGSERRAILATLRIREDELQFVEYVNFALEWLQDRESRD
jgi:hypothetical protein